MIQETHNFLKFEIITIGHWTLNTLEGDKIERRSKN